MVFYFTGTGNSLYAAKQLEEQPVSIPQAMKYESKLSYLPLWQVQDLPCRGKNDRLEFTADAIGIVAPIYGHEVPDMVREFMHRAVFHTDYFYMVLTYGNRHGGAAELAAKLCEECGIWPDYINVLLMVDNWLPSFDMDEQKKLDKKVEQHLAEIAADVQNRRRMIAEVTDTDRAAHQQFLSARQGLPPDAWQHMIRVTDACIGCGICEKVCPSDSIHVENGKTVHRAGHCQTCLACVHHCPNKAIELNVPEKNPNARYRNEHITLQEIMAANHQRQSTAEDT